MSTDHSVDSRALKTLGVWLQFGLVAIDFQLLRSR